MRFNKPAYPTVYFSEKIWVKCPSCEQRGLVSTELGKYTIPFPNEHQSVFNCNNCGSSKESKDEWFGYYQGFVGRGCSFCGSHVAFTSRPTKQPFQSTLIKCDVCKNEREYSINWYRFKEDKPTDPYFGLELWLQTEVKGNVLWVYNIDHLNYLKEYVSAKLREDDGRHKYSMISNLPQWIKSSKNRDIILRKLSKLEQEIMK
jgi:transcription elongation factor Elf1